MIKLVTKRTRRNKRYNTKKLAKGLDNITNKVAKRGIYVVVKADVGYNLIDHKKRETLVEAHPFKRELDKLCAEFNKAKKEDITIGNLQRHIDNYYKHYNDIQFYKHTIRTSQDKVKVFSAGSRLQDALHYLKQAKYHICI